MANTDWERGTFAAPNAGGAPDWEKGAFSTPEPAKSSTLSDLGKSVKAGVQRLPGMVTGLADLPIALATGARPVTAAADALGEATGFQPGKWADETKFSPAYEAGRQNVDEAWKDGSAGDIALAYLKNPGYTANQVAESLPSMVAGGVLGRAAMGAGAVTAKAANAATGTAARAATPGVLARTVGEKWAAPMAAGIGEGVVTAGQQMEQATGEDQQRNAVAALSAGALTGAIGVGAGRVANRLGLETAETAMAKIGTGATTEVPLSAQRRILGGMVSEAVLQELPQSAQEQMWQNYAEGKPLMEGVARASTEGAIAGGVMGAGANVSGAANRRARQADQQGRQRAEDAAASANQLAEEASIQNLAGQPVNPVDLGAPANFEDLVTSRSQAEPDPYTAWDQQVQAGARAAQPGAAAPAEAAGPAVDPFTDWDQQNAAVREFLGRPQDTPQQRPDYLAEVQAAVRSGTQFSTQQTVDTVRDAMEDAWLAENVGADPAGAPAPGAGLQAADAMGVQLQGQFQQASEDAGIAAVDARVRTGRILSGLQNLLDGGAENSAQVLGGLNEGLARINEQPLDTTETQRVRRMVDAYMGFRGVGEPAPLPADRAPAMDPFADNAAMEALIPQRPLQRPSERMGINPADGPLSRGAAMAVDAGFDATQQAALQVQEIANAQGAQARAAAVAAPAAIPSTGPGALEAAGPAPLTQTTGATFAPQADQAQQAGAQPPQATGAPGAPAAGAAAAQEGLTNASTTTLNNGAQGGAAPGPQGQAQAAAARPANWRSSALPAGRVARGLGIDPKGKRLAQILAEVDAADAARAGQQQAPENGMPPAAQGVDASAEAAGPDLTSIRSAGDAASVEQGAAAQFSRNMPEELAREIRKLRPPVSAATNASVRQAVNQLVGGMGMLPNSLGRIVVTTSDDIRANWEPLIGPVSMGAEGGGKAQGFYDPNTKTVFIISDHIVAGDELGVVAHELMHKHGPAVLGEEGWNQLHGAIGRWASAPEGSLERQVYNEAAARVRDSHPASGDAQAYSSQELFPYAVQVALEMGVRPNALAKPGTVARWLDQVRKVLRQVWAKIAGSRSDFASQDLVNLAFGIAQRENPALAGELDGATQEGPPNRRVSGTDTASGVERPGSSNSGDRPMVAQQFSRAAPAAPTASHYSAEQARAAEHAFGVQVKQTWAERAQAMSHNIGTKLRQGLVDQFAPLKEISEKAYILARLSKGSDGAVEAALLYGKPYLRDGVADVDIKDGGFANVLASLKGEHDRFFQWVAAQRAQRLKAEGKENLLTDRDITALRSLDAGRMADGTARMPLYAAALRELNAFNEASLKVARDSGLIDQAAYDLMKDQPYVPFYRLMEEDGGMRGPRFSSGLVNQQAWKKLKGGTQQLNADLLQNTLMNWSHLYAAAARNRASLETMDAAEKLGVAYRVPADTKGSVKVMREGVAEHWAVEDPYLVDAISAMSYTPPGIVKAMAPFKRLLTFGVTVNPTFKIRNLIRDSLSAIAQSDLSYNPLENVAKGWKATDKNSQTYASMLASGGIIKFGTQENTNQLRGQIERLGGTMLDKQGFDKLKDQMRSLWEVYEEFGDRTENVNRTALYERLRAKGLSHAEASFQARDLMDFSMSGKWETVRFLAQTVPFLNARLQGLYKLGRAAGEDPRRFAAMAGAVSMASLGLLAAYADDDDWKKREDFDRDNFWWFKIGDKAFRIPKPFEVGAIGTVAERTAELMMSEEMTGKRFGQRISDMVFNTFAMDPTPQAIKPFLEVYANKDSFSGRAIEGMADERLRPQDRYNERTSEVARLLGSWGLPDPVRLAKGEYSGLSPKQVDFLLRGYFGWLATVSTSATDAIARPMLDRGERPAMRLRDTFVAGNFVEELPTGSSRYVTTMYEQAKDVEQAWASYQAAIKSGDVELARSIQEEEGPKLRNRMAINAAKQQMAELGQRAKKIDGDRLLSAEAKRERLNEIEQRRNAIAERVAGLTN
ncbi:hypothetical protein DelCs14_2697 [Delftia sp. Cs1-4]|uniref:LPD38 domain-containing protein n=1 Tax=Delftia sp. (strain Cs1-4) TaxID=742013 RepID=UPI00020E82F5|nr:LPD38 domain-containing protein [Delftia sp. Cs1-4]AEF89709.1 hypothetical protein DelCs14_2697 [Delftia sp. Cs1-4]